MKKFKIENLAYLAMLFVVFVGGYIFLRYAYHVADQLPFSQEFVLVVLGTIATILITAMLLNKQTEVELKKEQSIKFIDLKSSAYLGLLDLLEELMLKETVSRDDLVRMQFLSHRLSIVAAPAVLCRYEHFLRAFDKSADDAKIDSRDSDSITQELGRLCVEIRRDLVGEIDDATDFSRLEISRQIQANVDNLPG